MPRRHEKLPAHSLYDPFRGHGGFIPNLHRSLVFDMLYGQFRFTLCLRLRSLFRPRRAVSPFQFLRWTSVKCYSKRMLNLVFWTRLHVSPCDDLAGPTYFTGTHTENPSFVKGVSERFSWRSHIRPPTHRPHISPLPNPQPLPLPNYRIRILHRVSAPPKQAV